MSGDTPSDRAPKTAAAPDAPVATGAFAPLRNRTFRRIWSASVLSNFGQLILGVGAAWEMTRLTDSPEMVALVQTAMMLPLMLVAVPAGAVADMFDRRKVAMTGLLVALASATTLTTLAASGLTTPWLLLGFCLLIGAGVAVYAPAWQASIREQVSPAELPSAVALGSISYNLARSFGPAIGGIVVLLFGATAAFGINAFCYTPLLLAFLLWRRPKTVPRLPPERVDRAIISGARYVRHSSAIRTVLLRGALYGFIGASVAALTPLVARELLDGNAGTYGLLLGVYGVGAVAGALVTGRVRERVHPELAVGGCTVLTGLAVVVIGFSRDLYLTSAAMVVAGAAWMLLVALLNVGVQLSAPRWVTGRALSWFQSTLTGGIAFGAWMWGGIAGDLGIGPAMIISGACLLATPLLAFLLPMPRVASVAMETVEIGYEPEVALEINRRSGPVVIEIDYDVDPDQARDFYGLMLRIQSVRQRNGAYDWSLARDIANPARWTERYHCPTWGDYQHLRSRYTQADLDLQEQINGYHRDKGGLRVRRQLERPFGSVRWRAETPDPKTDPITIYSP